MRHTAVLPGPSSFPSLADHTHKPTCRHIRKFIAPALLLAASALGSCKSEPSGPSFERFTTGGVECRVNDIACGDECVAYQADPANCGDCDVACGSDEICNLGACVPTTQGCSEELLLCAAGCRDSATDLRHCGICDNACPSAAECLTGQCECPGDLSVCGAECVDLQASESDCGQCGVSCTDTQTCEEGSCECPAAQSLCEDSCTDTDTSLAHCGQCGNECIGGQLCGEGQCACPDAGELCEDQCTNTQEDTANCGVCGNACTGGQICGEGQCVCPAGQALCDDLCIDVLNDNNNCGACEVSCALGDGCQTGQCSSGLLGDDECGGLAQDIVISQIAAYQTVKVQLMQDGAPSENPISALVAGRNTLVRFFVEPQQGWEPRQLSGRLHLDTGETISVQYSTDKLAPDATSVEDSRQSTFEFLVPGELITTASRFSAEVVECNPANISETAAQPLSGSLPEQDLSGGTTNSEQLADNLALDPQGGSESVPGSRFPNIDGLALDAYDTGTLRVHMVPIIANGRLADSSEERLALYERIFLATYPVAKVEITVGEPLEIDDPERWEDTLTLVRNRRQQDSPDPEVYYYGLVEPTERMNQFCQGGCVAGVGYVPRQLNPFLRVSVGLSFGDAASALTLLHEIGHNHGRGHSPCVPQSLEIVGVDTSYPREDGLIEVTGYYADSDQLISRETASDLMGYCGNQWLSAYTYNGLFNTILAINSSQASQTVPLARIGHWRVALASELRGTHWGTAADGETVAVGQAEQATALDAFGVGIESVTVYRTPIGDWGYSFDVPQPEPGWASIAIDGAEQLEF